MTLTPDTEHLEVELSLPFYDLGLSQLGIGHPTSQMQGEHSNRQCHHDSMSLVDLKQSNRLLHKVLVHVLFMEFFLGTIKSLKKLILNKVLN